MVLECPALQNDLNELRMLFMMRGTLCSERPGMQPVQDYYPALLSRAKATMQLAVCVAACNLWGGTLHRRLL
jgi:hypothetical protein